MPSKVFFPLSCAATADMFVKRGWEITKNPEEADLFQFIGGADVTPVLYGEERDPRTYCDPMRDLMEVRFFLMAQRYGIPCAGICRGGQFLNVMNGGKMIQHIEGDRHCNGQRHDLVEAYGYVGLPERVEGVTSTHHQMMVCNVKEGVVLYVGENGSDTEVVLYNPYEDCKSLCFQPHPEYDPASPMADLYFQLLEEVVIT